MGSLGPHRLGPFRIEDSGLVVSRTGSGTLPLDVAVLDIIAHRHVLLRNLCILAMLSSKAS